MTTHTTRPAVALAWVLGITLILTRPEILAAVNWTLTTPAGTAVIAVGFTASMIRAVRYRRWA